MQIINRAHFGSGQKLFSDLFNRLVDFPIDKDEQAHFMLRLPYESGLLFDAELPFVIQAEGDKIILKSIAAITASGHTIRYKFDNRDCGPQLVIDTTTVTNGNYFIYFYYMGESIPWVSSRIFGRTTREDIRVPRYSLELRTENQSLEDFPNSLLLGMADIENGRARMDRTFFPAIYQLGSYTKGVELLDRTKQTWDELKDVTFKIYRDLRDVPRDSVFVDTRDLAAELKTFVVQHDANFRHFTKKTSLFELFKIWSTVANIFRAYLFSDRLGIRPGDAIKTLYAAATRRGEYEIENYLLPTLETCSEHVFDINDPNATIRLIDRMIAYVAYTWIANYPIKLPNEKSISIQPNKF